MTEIHHSPLTEPPPALARIANAVGIEKGETYTLDRVADLVEAMAMDLAEMKKKPELELEPGLLIDPEEIDKRLRAIPESMRADLLDGEYPNTLDRIADAMGEPPKPDDPDWSDPCHDE